MFNRTEPKSIVLDFDGTFTNAEAEHDIFLPFWIKAISARLIKPILERDLADIILRHRTHVLAHPREYAWEKDEYKVASAVSDPYITTTVATRLALQAELADNVPSDTSIQTILSAAWDEASPHSGIAFRQDARTILKFLAQAPGGITFVTNSSPDVVKRKLASLMGKSHYIPVVGNAKKYQITPSADGFPTALPQSVELPDFPHPVLLWRLSYLRILQELGVSTTGIVVGDIFELDLALPNYLGLATIQITTPNTPPWEQQYMRSNSPQLQLIDMLADLPAAIALAQLR